MNVRVSAIRCEGETRVAMSLPEGSIVTVQLGERELLTGLVDVMWKGKPLLMFAVDLRERAERVWVVRERGKRS